MQTSKPRVHLFNKNYFSTQKLLKMNYKNLAFLLLVFGASNNELSAQTKGHAQYFTWVENQNSIMTSRSYLYELRDSTVVLCSNPNFLSKRNRFREFDFASINSLQFRKISHTRDGIALGATSGFALGFITGILIGDDPPCGKNSIFCVSLTGAAKGMILSIPGALSGALIGYLVTNKRIVIPINRDINTYQKQKLKLAKYGRQ